jgi:3-hydroxyethyl bacteriochlorophyllide a dehydrogenase
VVEVGKTEVPEPGPGEVLLRTLYSAVSPGTELRVFAGQQARMPEFPLIPGYSATAEVVAAGPGAALTPGTKVFVPGGSRKCSHRICWGAHVAHSVREASACFPLPPGVGALEASLVKLAAIAYHGVRLGDARPHETVAVVGLGPIGLISARLHLAAGAKVVAADRMPARLERAAASGAVTVRVSRTLAEDVGPLLDGGADVVVDATGAPAVLTDAVSLLRMPAWDDHLVSPGRVIVQGSYPASVAVDYNTCFMRETTLLFPRDHQARDVHTVLDLMARGRLRVDDLLSTVLAVGAASDGYARLLRQEALLVAFDWAAA